MKKHMMSRNWFIVGVLSAVTVGAFANIPRTGDTSGSMAPTQEVSEIRTKEQADLSFDQDLKRLSSIQGRYRENLPLARRKSKTVVRKKMAARPRAKVGSR